MAYLTQVQNLGGLIESTGIQTVFSSFQGKTDKTVSFKNGT